MSKCKPSMYLETNIFSSLSYRGGGAVASIRKLQMAEWWKFERKNFQLYTSRVTEEELSAWQHRDQARSIEAANRIPHLTRTNDVVACYKTFLAKGLFPISERADAIHLAFATIHRIDYLMTWNQAHLANAEVQRKLEKIAGQFAWRPPIIVTPLSIPWSTLGQEIRRMQ